MNVCFRPIAVIDGKPEARSEPLRPVQEERMDKVIELDTEDSTHL